MRWIGSSAALLVLCLALLAGQPLHAGIGEGNGEIGFDFGFTDFDSNTSDDDGSRFAVRGGYFFTDLIQLEGQIAGSVASEFIVDTALTSVMANVVFNFHPKEEIVPYVFAGFGQTTLTFDLGPFADVDDSDVSFQVGGGSRFFFGSRKKVAVRVDLSFLSESTFDESSTHGNLVVGFTWRLGPQP